MNLKYQFIASGRKLKQHSSMTQALLGAKIVNCNRPIYMAPIHVYQQYFETLYVYAFIQKVHSSTPSVVKLMDKDALEENYQMQTILELVKQEVSPLLEHQKKQDQELESLRKESM